MDTPQLGVALEPVPGPALTQSRPAGTRVWDPVTHGIRVRATGTPRAPVYTYAGPGSAHQLVVGPGAARTCVVDVTGHDDDPWFVVRVLAYGFFDLAYRETLRYQRQHVWKVARIW